jgi:hypothetical protein
MRYNTKGCYKPIEENNFYVPKGKFCIHDFDNGEPLNPKRNIDSTQFYAQRVGEFAPIEPKEANGKSVELKIVPAIIDETDYDFAIFLDTGEMKDENDIYDNYDGSTTKGDIYLRKYEKSDPIEIYDKIFVAFWNASIFDEFIQERTLDTEKWENHSTGSSSWWEFVYGTTTKRVIPHPIISNYEPVWADSVLHPSFFKFLSNEKTYSLALEASKIVNKKIDGRVKYTVKFIADNVPDVGSVFLIAGQQFLCKKITATFTEKGLSQLLKGEFYRVTS